MKHSLVFIALSLISGCTVVGLALDDKVGTDDYEFNDGDGLITHGLFTGIGWEFDKMFISSALSCLVDTGKETPEDIDDRACPEAGTIQVCTTTEGCWCESRK